MSSSSTPYKNYHIAHILSDHTNEVRSVSTHPIIDNACVTASYDGTVKIWIQSTDADSNKPKYQLEFTNVGHSDYIMSVHHSTTHLFSVGHDKSIIQWGENAVPQVQVDQAHEGAIAAVYVRGTKLITGSWDKTAKVWNLTQAENGTVISAQPLLTLKGHSNHVDAVCILPNGTFVTGSRDKSLRMWDQNGNCIINIPDAHQGSIRGFCVVPQLGFASVGSDGLIRLWTNKGNAITNWTAHDSLVYDVSFVPGTSNDEDKMTDDDNRNTNPVLITSSEDQTVKIWSQDGLLKQKIEFPSCIWETVALANGDVLVACGDMNAYVLSTDKSRVAVTEEQLKNIEKKIIESKEKRTGVDPSELEDVSVLSTLKGTKNGDKKMVNENGQSMIYIWNGAEWEKFGSVVEDPSLQGKQLNKEDGQFYDRVWKVEVSDGVQLTLGFNLGDDPTQTAIEFCQKHNLESYLVDQIVEFIMKNTGQEYRPVQSSQFGTFDPYSAMEREANQSNSALEQEKQKDHFPVKKPELVSNMPKPEAVVKKILSLNNELETEGNASLALSAKEAEVFEKSCQQLTGELSSATYSQEFFGVMEKLLQWPSSKRFPVLDVLRVVFLSADAETYFSKRCSEEKKNIAQEIVQNSIQDSSNFALQLMGLRTLINMCQWSNLKPLLRESISDIQNAVPELLKVSKDALRATIGRFLVNLSYVAHSESAAFKQQVLNVVKELKTITSTHKDMSQQTREDFAYNIVRSVGTLCLISILKAEEEVCKTAKPQFSSFLKEYEKSSVHSVKLQAASYQLLQVFMAAG